MKPSRLFFAAILVPIDYLMLILAGLFTYLVRFEFLRGFRPAVTLIPFPEFLNTAAAVALGWIALFALNGMYRIGRRRLMEEFGKVFFGCAAGFVAILLYLVFTQEVYTSRFILLGAFVSAIMFVSLGRLVIRGFERLALSFGIGAANLALIGAAQTRSALAGEFSSKKSLGFKVAAESDRITEGLSGKIAAMAKAGKIDGIVITDPNLPREDAVKILNLAEDLHLRFFYSADLFSAATQNTAVHAIAARPLIELRRTRLDGWGKIWKRVFDILGSFLLLILTSPILLICALAVFLETGRPIFFKNRRVGEHGREFNTMKFRTMLQKYSIGEQFENEGQALEFEKKLIEDQKAKKGPLYKIKNDPRVTGVGRFLRRWSLDELPQLWNVLRGDMSLVGPRPHQPREVDQYARRHRHVLYIKPGITGMAQISGRSDLDFEEEIRLDTYYIENWSISLDTFILLKTPFVIFTRKGAY